MHYTVTRRTEFLLRKEILRASVRPMALVALALGLVGAAEAESIEVKNAGFEAPVLSDGQETPTLDDWVVFSFGGGVGGGLNPTTDSFSGEAPEGENVAYSSDQEIFQVLDAVLKTNTTYTLMVDVGNRLDEPYAGYRIRLSTSFVGGLSGVVLAESHNSVAPASGTFETATLSLVTGPTHFEEGEQLLVSLYGVPKGGGQACFDNVRLDATTAATVPEPTGVIGLLSMLLVGLVGYGWRRGRAG